MVTTTQDTISRSEMLEECERWLEKLKAPHSEREHGARVAVVRLVKNLAALPSVVATTDIWQDIAADHCREAGHVPPCEPLTLSDYPAPPVARVDAEKAAAEIYELCAAGASVSIPTQGEIRYIIDKHYGVARVPVARGFNIPEIQVLTGALQLALRAGDLELAKDIRAIFQEHGIQITETPEGIRWSANGKVLS